MIMTVRTIAILILAFAFARPAAALEGLILGEDAVVASVVDGDTVVLDRTIAGATQVRLTGLQAPKLPLGRAGFREWPLAKESKAALEKMILGKPVRLFYGGARMDRHGRLLAHLEGPDGLWVQGEMLSLGMARVYTFADNRARADDMFARETAARDARRGIWAHPFYAIRPPDPGVLAADIDTFQVIEGRVTSAAEVKGVVFLNFGDNWRTDFTIRLDRRIARQFRRAGLTADSYDGRQVRVRGWLKNWNGPTIEANHPEQIEVLEK